MSIFEKVGTKIDILILYQKPVTKQGRKIVAEIYTPKGHFLIADTAFERDGKELKEKARKIYNSKTEFIKDQKRQLYEMIERSRSETNRSWVKCWECGRMVPPGKAIRDANGWYCGC